MRRFISKTTLFFLGVLIFVHSLAYVAERLAPDGNASILQADRQRIEGLLNQSQKMEALVVGNSHGYTIDLEALGYNGYQLARSGRDFFEVQYYLKGLIPRLPEIRTVFIPVSYFSFRRDNAVSESVRIRRIHTYIVIPYWWFIKGDFENFVIGKSHPIFPITSVARDDSWEGVFGAIFSGTQQEREQGGDIGSGCDGRELEYLVAHSRLRTHQHVQLTTEMAAKHPNLHLDTYETVVDTIQFLQQRDIRVIFFTPPYFETYTEFYQASDPETVTTMKDNMQTLQREYSIEYYDFSVDKEFISDHQLFSDSDHLNHCAARQFSEKLRLAIVDNER